MNATGRRRILRVEPGGVERSVLVEGGDGALVVETVPQVLSVGHRVG